MTGMYRVFLLVGCILLSGCAQIEGPAATVTGSVVAVTTTPAAVPTTGRSATSTPAPATPGPTLSPIATPTPIQYEVLGGDTLSAIAVRFGVSAEAIQEANGILNPRRLQVGQLLIIPKAEPGAQDTPTPTPTPVPLRLQGVNLYRSPQGTLWLWGEVLNPGGEPVSEVRVSATLLDSGGVPLVTETGSTQLDVIWPSQTVAFVLFFATAPSNYRQYELLILSGVPLGEGGHYSADLVVDDLHQEATGSNMYRISGRLENQGASTVEKLRVLVTAYDEQGRVVSVRQPEMSAVVLPAGAETTFSVDLPFGDTAVAGYSVKPQGLQVQAQ